jgi:hypothetical protein
MLHFLAILTVIDCGRVLSSGAELTESLVEFRGATEKDGEDGRPEDLVVESARKEKNS